jgi:hypothetical protein
MVFERIPLCTLLSSVDAVSQAYDETSRVDFTLR